jgi:adenine-specific DNA-methyltransferase
MYPKIVTNFDLNSEAIIYKGDCLDFLSKIPTGLISLVVTSPPYNLGKEYEKKLDFNEYLRWHKEVIKECIRVLHNKGSICWQIGNYVDDGEVFPLDIFLYSSFKELGLKLRNRIVWTFNHGLHASKRFSGRYETILWFTKTDDYTFNLDDVRIPQLYPQKKYYKGPKKGQLSSNPRGKNPGDVWSIPNVKHQHPEKTFHPCQFPEALIEKLVKATTNKGEWILDPFLGSGTTAIVALKQNRKVIGIEIEPRYIEITYKRLKEKFFSTKIIMSG